MIDTTSAALADHMTAIAKADSRDELEARCAEEITAAILAGKAIQCEGYRADIEDAAYAAATGEGFAAMWLGFLTGDIAPGLFHAYALRALDDYATRHAGARADYIEASASDEAEYYRNEDR